MNPDFSIELRDPQASVQNAAAASASQRASVTQEAAHSSYRSAQSRIAESKTTAEIRGLTRAPADADIFSRSHFLRQLQCEKRRSDRSKSPLSVALFRLGNTKGGLHHSFDRLLDLLWISKRETDIVGYLDDETAAVLLTDTTEEGARRFVRKITDRSRGLAFFPSVETYPAQLFESLAKQDSDRSGIESSAIDNVPPATKPGQIVKRCADFVAAAVFLVVLSPLMLAVAAAVAASSPGPVLFRQIRLGRRGRAFVFYKFRSMYCDTDDR